VESGPERVDFSNLPSPSRRTMTLESTQPLIKMSTRNLLGVKGGQRVRLTTLPPSVNQLSREKVGVSTSHKLMGLHGLLTGIVLPFSRCSNYIFLRHVDIGFVWVAVYAFKPSRLRKETIP
jgi:hypothetical protein